MRKILFILFAGLAVVMACCTNESPELKTDEQNALDEAPTSRSLVEAARAAIEKANLLYPNDSRSDCRSVDFNDVQCVMSKPSRNGQSDTLMYILNFKDNNGFAIVAAPRCANEVLAVVEKKSYQEAAAQSVGGFQYFLDASVDYCTRMAEQSKSNGNNWIFIDTLRKDPEPYLVIERRLDTIFENYKTVFLMDIEWGQTGIYGKYCPNGYSGCGSTAMGQIIACCNALTNRRHIDYTFPGADISSEEINWSQLKRHIHSAAFYPGSPSYSVAYDCREDDPSTTHNTIGRYLRQIGHDANADYTDLNGTGTAKRIYRSVLQKYLPDRQIPDFKTYDAENAQNDIDHGMLLMRSDNEYNGRAGHVWVADAYHWICHQEEYRVRDVKTNLWGPWTFKSSVQNFTHFNWGWDGYLNGYFDGIVFECMGETFDKPEYIAVKKFVN